MPSQFGDSFTPQKNKTGLTPILEEEPDNFGDIV